MAFAGLAADIDGAGATGGVEIYLDGDRNGGGETHASDSAEATSAPQTTSKIFCVRLCDGYYFPLESPQDAHNRSDTEAACYRLCPGTEMEPYYQDAKSETIDGARSSDLQPYGALKTAYAYATRLRPACGCRRPASLKESLLNDPTLRKGDIVVTSHGLVMFQGFENTNMPERNFASIRSERLPAQYEGELRTLDGMYRTEVKMDSLEIVDRSKRSPDSGIRLVEKPEVDGDGLFLTPSP